jgi:pyrroline-5-carboxylate reductase
MGTALVAGLLDAGWAGPEELVVVEPIAARREELAARHAGLRVEPALRSGTEPASSPLEGAVIAVKPSNVEEACRAVTAAGVGRVLSIAAGVPLARLEEWLGPGVPVVRAMPNMAALVGCGAAAIAAGTAAREADLDWAESILGSVGTVVGVPEAQLDAVTGLSGSGPAYVFLVAEALTEAGVLVGLTREVSRALVVQTLLGSARLLVESGQSPEELRAAVTSPGGTTAAAVRALEAAGFRGVLVEAVAAATERSRQLGQA